MKYYLAPMEGITGYIYRNAYHHHFGNIDRYYSPFIVPHKKRGFKESELRDILPENNKEIQLIPQLLTNDWEDFLLTQESFFSFGYEEINLNLGCPSPTVTAKKKGAGCLEDPFKLNRFLEKLFTGNKGKISIKTRLGTDEPEEFYDLIRIFNQYPIEELIIHPRIQKEFYQGKPHRDIFCETAKISRAKICYNGDVSGYKDIKELEKGYKDLCAVMIGRGILRNPGLVGSLKQQNSQVTKEVLKKFHDEIYEGYRQIMSGERNALFRMKELWFYLADCFEESDKYLKKIKKVQNGKEYEAVVNDLFLEKTLK